MSNLRLFNTLRVFVIGAIALSLFILNTNAVYSLAPHAAIAFKCNTCNCNKKCLCDKASGLQGHREQWDVTVLDISNKYQELSVGESAYTCVFFMDSIVSNDSNITGEGYINIQVSVRQNDAQCEILYHVCDVCEEQRFTNYADWLAVCEFIYNPANYVGGKALVYPNPTSSNAFIKLNDAYLSGKNIQTALYQLFGPNQASITTINNTAGIVQIPSSYLTSNGMHTIKCNISYLNAQNQLINDTFILTFIVN